MKLDTLIDIDANNTGDNTKFRFSVNYIFKMAAKNAQIVLVNMDFKQ